VEAGACALPMSTWAMTAAGGMEGEACRVRDGEWNGALAVGTRPTFTYVATGAARVQRG
jgi:hypothetical protein